MPENHQEEKGIRMGCQRVTEMKRDPNTMSKIHQKEKGFEHDIGEPQKRKGIWTRCWRAIKTNWDLDTMLESRKKEKGFRQDAEELLK